MSRGGFFSVDSLRGVHVLVVDDDRDSRDLVVAILQYCGALVTAVARAAEALDVMRQVKPDVLVVDLGISVVEADRLLRSVRGLKPEDGGTVPAIAYGGQARAERRDPAAADFDAYVAKPVNPWELCRLITSLTAAG